MRNRNQHSLMSCLSETWQEIGIKTTTARCEPPKIVVAAIGNDDGDPHTTSLAAYLIVDRCILFFNGWISRRDYFLIEVLPTTLKLLDNRQKNFESSSFINIFWQQ